MQPAGVAGGALAGLHRHSLRRRCGPRVGDGPGRGSERRRRRLRRADGVAGGARLAVRGGLGSAIGST